MEKENVRGSYLGKLPYILLELLNNESPDSVDYIIAKYILDNIKKLRGTSIQEISDACEVSKSTLSRFCRKAGLEDFQEMKEELNAVKLVSSRKFDVPLVDSEGKRYLQRVSEQALKLDEALDYQQIDKLAREIDERKNVLLLGSMQAMNPAVNLQQDMLFYNKVVRVPSRFSLQMSAIERAKKDDLLICFSNSGLFFERLFETQGGMKKLNELRIWMITGNEKACHLPYINEAIYIPDNHGYIAHPTQFNLTARVIAMAYGKYQKKA